MTTAANTFKDKLWDRTLDPELTLGQIEQRFETLGMAAFWMALTGSTHDHVGYYELMDNVVRRECPECEGAGWFHVEFHHADEQVDCVDCDGKGYIEEEL